MTTAHEPHRGPDIHLSVEDLSALAEGAQPTAEGASEHLVDCAACRDEVAAIAQLLAAFETLEPPQVPQEVAIRIDAALAREAAARASAPNAAAESATAAGKSSGRRRRPWLSRRVGLGLASLAAVVGGLTLAINLVSSNTQSGSAASGSGAINPDAATGGPRRAEGQIETPSTLAPTSPLALWVKQTLGSAKPGLEINSPCLANPAFAGEQPIRVVNGPFNGVSATLVVYPNDGDARTVQAVVYAQPCTATSYRVLAQGIVAK